MEKNRIKKYLAILLAIAILIMIHHEEYVNHSITYVVLPFYLFIFACSLLPHLLKKLGLFLKMISIYIYCRLLILKYWKVKCSSRGFQVCL